MNSINEALCDILDRDYLWKEVAPRGLKTKETINAQLYLDPTRVIFNTTTRPWNIKYFCGEFKWFLSKSANISGISPEYSSFWLKLQNEQGEVNSNYGRILLTDRGFSQLYWVYNSLVKDKFTRQAIAFISGDKYQTEGNLDFPCTIYMNFYIRDEKLNMIVRMRSNDLGFGLTYDAPWFSLIQQNLLLLLKEHYPKLKLGVYIHSADNLHYYERHYKDLANIEQKSDDKYQIILNTPFFNFIDKKTIITDEAKWTMEQFTHNDDVDKHRKEFSNLVSIIEKI